MCACVTALSSILYIAHLGNKVIFYRILHCWYYRTQCILQRHRVIDLIAPRILELFNRSLAARRFPSAFKDASRKETWAIPISVHTDQFRIHRSRENCWTTRRPLHLIVEHLTSSGLLPTLQPVFRLSRSTKTAVLQGMSELMEAIDKGDMGVLILDLSEAFDTVEQIMVMLSRWQQSFGVDGIAHLTCVYYRSTTSWLTRWRQYAISASSSTPTRWWGRQCNERYRSMSPYILRQLR